MQRQLKELVERQRGEVKEHPQQQAMALVEKLFPDQEYGFLRTLDGREVYFHSNSVLHIVDKPGSPTAKNDGLV
jgi:hypothetical protein